MSFMSSGVKSKAPIPAQPSTSVVDTRIRNHFNSRGSNALNANFLDPSTTKIVRHTPISTVII